MRAKLLDIGGPRGCQPLRAEYVEPCPRAIRVREEGQRHFAPALSDVALGPARWFIYAFRVKVLEKQRA
jgi:hypothetical protein